MRLLYISRINFLSDRAHVYTVTKTCEALQAEGSDVTLAAFDGSLAETGEKERFYAAHNVRTRFRIVSERSFGERLKHSGNRILYHLSAVAANLYLLSLVVRMRKDFDVLYFRDHLLVLPTLAARLLGKTTVFEAHYVLENRLSQWIADRFAAASSGVVIISGAMRSHYERLNRNLLVSFCAAAEPERFAGIAETKDELRSELGLPLDRTVLMYTGNIGKTGIGDSYGVEDIVAAMPLMPSGVSLVVVGKRQRAITAPEVAAKELGLGDRALFKDWVERSEVPKFLLTADILLVPASGGRVGNSPTKMFEYLVSGRPIVAASTEAIKEVLRDGVNALLVDSTKPGAWADAVKRILSDETLRSRLLEGAAADSKKYTWRERGRLINEFIEAL